MSAGTPPAEVRAVAGTGLWGFSRSLLQCDVLLNLQVTELLSF